MKRSIKQLALTLLAMLLPCFAWAAEATLPTPVLLLDFGTSTVMADTDNPEAAENTDGWKTLVTATGVEQANSSTSHTVTGKDGNSYSVTHVFSGAGKVFNNGTWTSDFATNGTFNTPDGAASYGSALKEMQATLGLTAEIPEGVYKDTSYTGNGSDRTQTVTITGLNDQKYYVLYFIGAFTQNNTTPIPGFQITTSGGAPVLYWAKHTDTSYTKGSIDTRILGDSQGGIIARVHNLQSSGGTLVVTITSNKSPTNAIAIAEMDYIAPLTPTYTVSATVGGETKKYATINEAVANEATAITLLDDIEVAGGENLIVNAPITGAHSMTIASGKVTLTKENVYTGSTVVNNAATLVLNADNAADDVIKEGSTVTVHEGGKIELVQGVTYVKITGEGTTKVTGANFTYGMSGNLARGLETATVEVDENAVLQFRTWNTAYEMSAVKNLIVNGTIKDDGYSNAAIRATSISLPAEGRLSGTGTIALATAFADGATIDASAGTIEVADVTFPASGTLNVLITNTPVEGTPVTVLRKSGLEVGQIVTLGTFSVKIGEADAVTSGYKLATTATGYAVDVAGSNICTMGDVGYETIQDAINHATGTAIEITVTGASTEESITVPAGKTLTLTMDGGSFSGTVKDSYGVEIADGGNNTYAHPDYEAEIGTTPYLTMADAIAAGAANNEVETITLLKDVSIAGTTEEGQSTIIADKITSDEYYGVTITGGSVTYTAENTYTGATTVNAGVLVLDATSASIKPLPDKALVSIAEGATVRLVEGWAFANYSGAGTIEVDGTFVAGATSDTTTSIYVPSVFYGFTGTLRVNNGATLSLRSFGSDLMGLAGCNLDIQGTLQKDPNHGDPVSCTVASGKTLSGNGTISVPVTLEAGATINASTATAEKCLTLSGGVTLPDSGMVTLNVAGISATTDTTILAATAALDTTKFALTGAANGWTLEASGNTLVLAAPYSGNFSVGTAEALTAALEEIAAAKTAGTLTGSETITLIAGVTITETIVIDVGEGKSVTIDLADNSLTGDDSMGTNPVIRIQSGTLNLVTTEAAMVFSSSGTIVLVGAKDNALEELADEACSLNLGAGVSAMTYGTSAIYVASGTLSGAGSAPYSSITLASGTTIDASAGTKVSAMTFDLPADALTVKLAALPEEDEAKDVLALSYGGTASDDPVVTNLTVVVGEDTYTEGYKLVETATGYAVKAAETLPACTMTWMPIGDSITEGESTDVSYRHELWDMLTEQGYNIQSVGVRNGTHDGTLTTEAWSYHNAFYGARINTGSSTRQRLSLDEELEVCGYPDIITILLGANDVSDYAAGTASDADAVTALVNRWVEYVDRAATLRPNSQIFVGTVMNFKSNHSKASTVEPFNTRIRALKEAGEKPFTHANVTLVELNKNESGETGLLADSDFVDQVHPNATGCVKVATRFYNAIVSKLPKSDAAGAAVPEMAFNDGTTAVKVLFDRPLDATAAASIEATLTGVDGITLSTPTLSVDGRTLTLTASAALPVLKEVTVTMNNVVAANATEADGVAVAFTILGTGAAENVPADVRNGFTRYAKKNIGATDRYNGSVTYDEKVDSITDYGRVAYYMELKRAGKPAQFVWVAMDAFTNDINAIGIPTSATGLHQQVVTGLTMYANRGNFLEKNVTTPGTGFIEFTPGTYAKAASGITGAPTDVAALDWNDTLSSTGGYGCMQVSRILTDAYAPAEMVFALNRFTHNSSSEVEIGIGSFSGHLKNNGTGLGSNSIDRTFLSDADWNGLMASDYTVRTLEIWVTEPVETTWKGATNAAWETEGNWTYGVPVAGVEAIIPAGSMITVAGDIAAKSITISGTGAVTLTAGTAATATIAETVVAAEQTLTLTGLTLTGAVAGAGTLSVDKLPTVTGLNDSTLWQGTVELNNITKADLDLRLYGCTGSTITLNGVSGHWTYDNATNWPAITIPANICIKGTNTNDNGYSSQRYILTGKITGDGTLQHTTAGGAIYQIKGDMSEFTGTLSAAASGQFILGETNSTAAGKILIAGEQTVNCKLTAVNGIVIESTAVVSGTGTLNSATAITSGATLDVSGEPLTAAADVTFPADGTVSVKVDENAEFPATIIARSGLVAEQEDIIGGVSLTIGKTAAVDNYKLVKTTAGYAVAAATANDPVCTVNGTTNYTTLADALTALSTTGGTIRMNKGVTLTETIVVNVGDTNTLTIDLAGCSITSTAEPAVLVKTGTLQLTTSNPSATGIANYIWATGVDANANTAIVVGDETSVNPKLVIGANTGVTSTAETTVDLVKGTIGGSGTIGKNLKLANGVKIDTMSTILTVGGIVVFPGQVPEVSGGFVNSSVYFLLPDDTVFPHAVINCDRAEATHAAGTTLDVNDFLHANYGLINIYDNATGLVAGYGLKQYVCVGGHGDYYASVDEAIRAGEKTISLCENTQEHITLPDGVTLELALAPTEPHMVTGSITVKSGATLEPRGGDIDGNLILEDGATLSVYMEVQNPASYDFHVSGTVTFPTGTITVIAEEEGTTVALGVPQQIISTDSNLTPGATLEGTTVNVVSAAGQAASEDVKIISTSTTYEIVSTTEGVNTLDGVDYADLQQAINAIASAANNVITLKENIQLEDTTVGDVTVDGTLVIDVGAGNTAVIDLAGYNLTSTADPAIRIKSGSLAIINSSETAATLSTSTATAILVGASDDVGTAVAADAGCILDIGDKVTIAAETTAVNVVVGTVAGSGTLNDTLVLANGAIVDATHGILTMADGAKVTFPGTDAKNKGTITVLPPAGVAYPSQFIACTAATAADYANTDLLVKMGTTTSAVDEFTLTLKTVDVGSATSGYAIATTYAAARVSSAGEVQAYYATFANAVAEAATTDTIVLLSDVIMTEDVATSIYTNGYNISGESKTTTYTISGKLTLTQGTEIPRDTLLSALNVFIEADATVTINGSIASGSYIICSGSIAGRGKIDATLFLADGAEIGSGTILAPTGGTLVDADAVVTIDGYLFGSLRLTHATIEGEGAIFIEADDTLAGNGEIYPVVTFTSGATIEKVEFENAPLILHNLTPLTEEARITVTAMTLGHVLNTKAVKLDAANFVVTLDAESGYDLYTDQTEGNTIAVPVVATNNGDYTLGIVKLNFVIGGAALGADIGKQLAAYGYRYGLLEIKGVYADSDPIEGFQLFNNVVNGFVGDYLVVTYNFGITALNIVTVNATKYVIVTADVDGVYDKTEGDDLSGNAGYREGTTVQLYKDKGTTPLVTSAMGLDTAKSYGLVNDEADELPPGVAYFAVRYDNLFPTPDEGDETPPSETVKFTVKATNPGTNEEAWEGEE